MKSSEVCIKTRSPPASLTIQGQVTKYRTVKWPIDNEKFNKIYSILKKFFKEKSVHWIRLMMLLMVSSASESSVHNVFKKTSLLSSFLDR